MKLKVLLLTVLIALSCLSISYAEEEITLSTFYPAPYGDYDELTADNLAVNKMVVGPTYAIPTDDGDLVVEGNVGIGTDTPQARLEVDDSIRFTPRANDPSSWAEASIGEFAYSSDEGALYHYNGSTWVAAGGGGGCYTSYSGGCLTGFTNMGSAGWWGTCVSVSLPGAFFYPPGGDCGSWGSYSFDEACVCCK